MTPWTRRLSLGLAGLGLLLVAETATAQSLSFATDALERPNRDNDYNLMDEQINQADCIADAELRFHVVYDNLGSYDIEVWEGSSCIDETSREGANAVCRRVYDDGNERDFNIRIQDLVEPANADDAGTENVCYEPKNSEETVTLHFMLMNGTTPLEGFTPPTMQLELDLEGPPPPTDVKIGIGEDSLIIDFEENDNSEDVLGYNFYCEAACPGTALAADTIPPADYLCGDGEATSESGQTNGEQENGVTYTVGVAATDKFGNPGKLSETACGTPEEIVGFYEAYRAAGGKGGGGNICSFSAPARSGLGSLGAAAALVLAAAVRRGRSARRRS